MKIFDSYGSPSAKVSDGRLVLSLPDAETPALWMMDLNDAATSVLRIETDRQGFYVIKKHGGKGAAETIAVYRDRMAAGRALDKASRALEKARNTRPAMDGRPVVIRSGSKIMRFLNILLVIWFVLYVFGIDRAILQTVFPMQANEADMAALQQMLSGMDTPAQPQGAAPAADSGSQSADDFLKQQQQQNFPMY